MSSEACEPEREVGREPPLREPGMYDVRRPPSSNDGRAPIGRLRSDFSLILVMGPEMLCLCPCPETELPGLGSPAPDCARDLNGVIDCDTPDASVNCSRSSTFVRPLALHGSFLTRNSSSATQPPPTRTMTVERRMRTKRSF